MGLSSGIDGVLFDLDGTLADTYGVLVKAFRHATREVLHRDVPIDRFVATMGMPLHEQMPQFTPDPAECSALVDSFRVYEEAIADSETEGFPGTEAMLSLLIDAGFSLGVVTSKRHETSLRTLETLGLADYFSCLIGSDDVASPKPDPDPVMRGASALGLAPARCVYVGDSPYDMVAGRGAGSITFAALWGVFPEEVLRAEAPDRLCARPLDVSGLLA